MFVRVFYNYSGNNINNKTKIQYSNGECNTKYLPTSSEKCGFIYNEYFCSPCIKNNDFIKAKSDATNLSDGICINKLIVCLHGWGVDSSLYIDLCKRLSNYGFVICPDFSGFGNSDEPNRPFEVSDYAEQIFKLIRLFEFDELIIVGHSFGCRVISKLISFNSEIKLSKIILTGAAGLKPKFSIIKYLKIKRYKYLKKKCKNNPKMLKKLYKYGSNDYKNIKADIMRQTFKNVINEELQGCYSQIGSKTLLIFGSKDKETPLYMARKLKKLIIDSKLIKIKNAGHFAFLDAPHEFYEHIDKFLSS